jgi:very-short-patch-repair endonuclease
MMTFPSTDSNSEKAMDFRRVDGQFLRKATVAHYRENPNHPHKEAIEKVLALGLNPVGTNPVEANEIVEEIIERLGDPKRTERRKKKLAKDPESRAESIIVVTFNEAQMHLINELLETHPKSQEVKVKEATEPEKDEESGLVTESQLKIRNLETVQGDEAETVIFSVAFSKKGVTEVSKPTNSVPLNFGPVTQKGGYRRLNVAATRAQQQMIIFCSFDPTDMKVDENHSLELQLLRKFLTLAKNPDRSGDTSISVQHSSHIEEIARSIREMGYRVKTQHGLSSLRIDIAVGQPDHEDWEIAVLLDGPSWRDRGSAEQREVMPLAVLPTRGWKKVIRVWLPSWLDEKDAILEKIRNAMDRIEEPPDELPDDLDSETSLESNQGKPSEEEETEKPHSINDDSVNIGEQPATGVTAGGQLSGTTTDTADTHPEFKPFNPDSHPKYDREILDIFADPHRYTASSIKYAENKVSEIFNEILATEAPVELSRFVKLFADCFGFQQVRKNRVDFITNLIPKDLITQTPFGDYIWASSTQADTWTTYRPSGLTAERKLQEMSPMEYSNALVDLVTASRSLSRENAVQVLAEIFGFTRLTQKTRDHIEKIVDYVIQQNLLFVDDNERLRVTKD